MNSTPFRRLTSAAVALFLGLAFALTLGLGLAFADDPPVVVLGAEDDIAGAADITDAPATFALHVGTALTKSVEVEIILVRLVDSAGHDRLSAFEIDPRKFKALTLDPTEQVTLTVGRKEELGPDPGTYTLTLALVSPQYAFAPQETHLRLTVTPTSTAPSLHVRNDELVIEFARQATSAELDVQVEATGADATGVSLNVVGVKTGDKLVAPDFWRVDPPSTATLPATMPTTLTLILTPGNLPQSGTYTGQVVVKADNVAAPATKTLNLIVRQSALLVTPAKLEIVRFVRCIPSPQWWPWVFTGCGRDDGNGLTVETTGEYSVPIEIAHEVVARTASGRAIRVEIEPIETAVEPRKVTDLAVTTDLSGTERVGVYTGTLHITSRDLPQPKSVDIKLTVRHLFLIPIGVIGAGVLIGFIILWLRDPENDPYLVRLDMRDLSRRLAQEKGVIPKTIAQDVQALLDEASIFLRARLIPQARAKVDEAIAQLKRYDNLCVKIRGLEAKIKSGQPGYKDLEAARKALRDGELKIAETHAGEAEKLHQAAETVKQQIDVVIEAIVKASTDPSHQNCSFCKDARDWLDAQRKMLSADSTLDDVDDLRQAVEKKQSEVDGHLTRTETEREFDGLFAQLSALEYDALTDAIPELSGLRDQLDATLSPLQMQVLRDGITYRKTDLEARAADRAGYQPPPPLLKIKLPGPIWTNTPAHFALHVARTDDEPDPSAYHSGTQFTWSVTPSADFTSTTGTEVDITFQDTGIHRVAVYTNTSKPPVAQAFVDAHELSIEPDATIQAREPVPFWLAVDGTPVSLDPAYKKYTYAWTARYTGGAGAKKKHGPLNPVQDGKPTAQFEFPDRGKVKMCVGLLLDDKKVASTSRDDLKIAKSDLERIADGYHRRQVWLSVLSFIVATLGGMVAMKTFRPAFGALEDYVSAFLWGAGVNVTAQGIGNWTALVGRMSALWPAKGKKAGDK
jgi:hypothetical protein